MAALSAPTKRASLGFADVDDGDELRIPVNVAPMDRWLDGLGFIRVSYGDSPLRVSL